MQFLLHADALDGSNKVNNLGRRDRRATDFSSKVVHNLFAGLLRTDDGIFRRERPDARDRPGRRVCAKRHAFAPI